MGRYEGLYVILYYLTIMLISTFISNKYKKVLVNAIIICGSIQAIYAVFQSYNLFNVKQYYHPIIKWNYNIKALLPTKELWILGFTNNPNFLGTYMLLCLSYSLGLTIDNEKKYQSIIYGILSLLFMFALLLSNCSSSVVGLLLVLTYMCIYCLKNKKVLKLGVIFCTIVFTTVGAVKLNKTTLTKDLLKIGNEATEITKGNLDDNYGSQRIYVWKETIKILPKYIWHGVGIDNFGKAFNGEALVQELPNRRITYDKAHNEYLQTFITQGILAFLTYGLMFGYALLYGIKQSWKQKQLCLVLPVIGYLAQAFFNISVIEVAPIFWIGLGLCCSKK